MDRKCGLSRASRGSSKNRGGLLETFSSLAFQRTRSQSVLVMEASNSTGRVFANAIRKPILLSTVIRTNRLRLMDAASLQDCSLPAKISLFLAGFDLSLSKDNKNLLVIPMSDDVEVSARTSSIRVTPSQKQAWAKLWPQAKAKSTKDTEWQITGPAKAHRELLRPSNPSGKSTQRPTSNKKLSGKIQGPLGDLLRQLAEANQLQVEPWPLPEPIAGKRVDLQVENVTIEELFQRMAESTGTVIRVEGKSLKVQ